MSTESKEFQRLLAEQMGLFRNIFEGDLKLIQDKARDHGIQMTTGNILTPPVWGAYNLRIPSRMFRGREVEKVFEARKVVVACIDYRQSAEVYDAERPDIFIADAGGGAQPDSQRSDATVNLLSLFYQVNPEIEIVVIGHNNICGGVNHATGGRMYDVRSYQGIPAEIDMLAGYLCETHAKLVRKGVPGTSIRLGFAQIGDADDFLGVVPVSPA